MPWMVPSHQAPVLPLKRWKPGWFSGLGLVLGTAAPDLAFVLTLDENGAPLSHTAVGVALVSLPLVLVLHTLATTLVFPWLLPRLPGGAPLHLHALARSRPATDLGSMLRVAVSGVLGAATHVFIDGFTHGDHSGWALRLLPVLASPVLPFGAPLYDLLQVVLTVGLGTLALREWHCLASAPSLPGPGAAAAWEVVPAPPAERRGTLLLLLGAAAAGAVSAPLLKSALGTTDALKLAAYGAITSSTLVVIGAAAAYRARLMIDRVLVEVGSVIQVQGWPGPAFPSDRADA